MRKSGNEGMASKARRRGLVDPCEHRHRDLWAELDAGATDRTLNLVDEQQRAVEGLHPELLVGPVEGGREGGELAGFHLAEGTLGVGSGAVGGDDLVVRPLVAVGEDDALAELAPARLLERSRVSAEARRRRADVEVDPHHVFEPTAAQDLVDAFLAAALVHVLAALDHTLELGEAGASGRSRCGCPRGPPLAWPRRATKVAKLVVSQTSGRGSTSKRSIARATISLRGAEFLVRRRSIASEKRSEESARCGNRARRASAVRRCQ